MYKKERILDFLLFLFVFIIYSLSLSKTFAFWDSPEFIISSYELSATHPPGAPLYTLFCSFIYSFTGSYKIALISGLISSLFGAITVVFVYKITLLLANSIIKKNQLHVPYYLSNCVALISSLTLAFSSSFWTAATEAEVYTMSFSLLSIIIYVSLLWEKEKNRNQENRYLLLIFFLLGLSIGVHSIILTSIIPLSLLYTSKKYRLNLFYVLISLLIGVILFLILYSVLFHGVIKTSNAIDIWLVNRYETEVNTGVWITLIGLIFIFSALLLLSYKKNLLRLNFITLLSIFFFLGFSLYLTPLIRSNSQSLIANKTNNSNRLLQYVQAKQFGIDNIPLIKGYTYNAPLNNNTPFKDSKPSFYYNDKTSKYEIAHNGISKELNFAKEFSMWFPRIYDSENEDNYKSWTKIIGEPINYPVLDQTKEFYKPTFKENLAFFYNYQVHWLYLRYLFWNFVGKQNNNHGLGFVTDGNWVSGINFVDKNYVGDISVTPTRFKNDKSHNTYFFIPFILGIIGLIALRKNTAYLFTTLFLFLIFGLGITIYINPLPSSILIRERDYIFIGSYLIFSIWVGLSVIELYSRFSSLLHNKFIRPIILILIFIGAPIQLLAKGWNDHNRSHDTFPYQFAKAYLDSCPEQAILITNGDNMTFPLWYLQEVENYRTDVRVLNFDQLYLDSHIDRLNKKVKKSNPIKFDLNKELYINGVDKLIPFNEEIKEPADLKVLFNFLKEPTTKINWNNQLKHYIPSNSFNLQIDSLTFKKNINLPYKNLNTKFIESIKWNYPKDFYGINDLVVLNIIKNNIEKRPICFTINGKKNHYLGLDSFFIQHGMIEQLAPLKRINQKYNPKLVNSSKSYDLFFNENRFTSLNDNDNYINPDNVTYTQTILRRNYYFTAQALLEQGHTQKAISILNKSVSKFPNSTVPFKQYAFAIGKLYHRLGEYQKGNNICKIAINNIGEELFWTTSFNPINPIINVRHAEKLKNMYAQMLKQYPGNKEDLDNELKKFNTFLEKFQRWKIINWPY